MCISFPEMSFHLSNNWDPPCISSAVMKLGWLVVFTRVFVIELSLYSLQCVLWYPAMLALSAQNWYLTGISCGKRFSSLWCFIVHLGAIQRNVHLIKLNCTKLCMEKILFWLREGKSFELKLNSLIKSKKTVAENPVFTGSSFPDVFSLLNCIH